MAGARVSIRLQNKRAGKALLNLESNLRTSAGTLTVGINRHRRYYSGRSQPVALVRIAAWNEYGVPGPGGEGWLIPPRPAITTALSSNEAKYQRSMRARISAQARKGGTKGSYASTMRALGAVIVSDIKASILGWTNPPNARTTVARKGVDNPLVESGRLANAFEATWTPANNTRDGAVTAAARKLAAFKGDVGA